MEVKESCLRCEYERCPSLDDPCVNCSHAYISQFEPKRTAVKIAVEVRKINDIISLIEDPLNYGVSIKEEVIKMLEELKHNTKEVR